MSQRRGERGGERRERKEEKRKEEKRREKKRKGLHFKYQNQTWEALDKKPELTDGLTLRTMEKLYNFFKQVFSV